MRRLLFFLAVLLLSFGWANAQQESVVENFELEPNGGSNPMTQNTQKSIPNLKLADTWKVTATTTYKGDAFGPMGFRLFALQNSMLGPMGAVSGCDFGILPQDAATNAGLITFNGWNNVGKFNTEPLVIDPVNGIVMTFVITNDGSGAPTITVTAGDQTFPPLVMTAEEVATAFSNDLNIIRAAQTSPVSVSVEYYPVYLDLSRKGSMNFGTVLEGEEAGPGTVTVTASDKYSDPVSYELTTVSGPEDAFYIDPESESNFSSLTGGQLLIYLEAYEAGSYEALLTVTRGSVTQTLTLVGKAVNSVPVTVSPAIGDPNADAEGNVWYRIQSNRRTGYVLTDLGADMALEATYPDMDNADQLWKFIATSTEGQFKLVSKNGRELGYKLPIMEGDIEVEQGTFITSASSNDTYSFQLRSDANWQLIWNEYEPAPGNENPANAAYVNKMGGGDSRFTAYYSQTGLDDGNSMQFYLHSENILPEYPEFSTDTKEVWYYIQFDRRSVNNKVWEELDEVDETLYTNLIQAEKKDEEAESQYWKLIGDKDNFKIVSYNTNSSLALSLTETGSSRMQSVEYNDGNPLAFSDWTFNEGSSAKSFQLQIINMLVEGESSGYFYLNDFQGTAICQYLDNDAGNFINFIPVDDGTAIDVADISNMDNDPVIATQYYTLQGILLGGKPSEQGIYIEKNIHESKSISVRKVFIDKN